MAKVRPPTANIVPTWGSPRNQPTGAAAAAMSAERPIPEAIVAQNGVDRTRWFDWSGEDRDGRQANALDEDLATELPTDPDAGLSLRLAGVRLLIRRRL